MRGPEIEYRHPKAGWKSSACAKSKILINQRPGVGYLLSFSAIV